MNLRAGIVLLLGILLTAMGFAQPAAPNPVKWTAEIAGGKIAPAGKGTLKVIGTLEPGWHLYATEKVPDGPFPTQFKVSGKDLTLGSPIDEPGVKEKLDKGFGVNVKYFEEKAEFGIPVAAAAAALGQKSSEVSVTYQVCNDQGCLRPTTVAVPLKYEVSDSAVAPVTTTAKAAPKPTDQKNLLTFLLIAIGAGFGALVTPCVFPMIPITVSVFSKEGKGEGIKKAVAFCIGIISTFTLLGIGFSVLFGASGLQNFANNPWLNLSLAILFIVLSLSLFGVYEIGLPSGLANKLNPNNKGGLVGPILMGLVFSLTSFTCTLPFVGTLLVSATQGDLLYPLVGMLGFSTAFSIPFFLLALFPQYLSKLPKSGGWLAVVKAFMGFLELAAAMKFLSMVDLTFTLGWLTRPVFLAGWAILMSMAAAFLLGWFNIPTVYENKKPGWFRRGFGVATFGLVIWILSSINGTSLGKLESFLPPEPYPVKPGSKASVIKDDKYLYDLPAAKAKAVAEKKPILIDFTGIYCSNCRDMEKNVIPEPDVQESMKGFVLAKLYTDRLDSPSDTEYQNLKVKLTGTVANPVYAIVTPAGDLISFTEYEPNPGKFNEFLKAGLAKFKG